jgi:two-component system cell cycle sensor histidine kinase/response regulator CckA
LSDVRPIETLREQVRGALDGIPGVAGARDIARLLHELDVSHSELELQNHELRRAQAEIEASRDRYRELVDLAPLCYLRLDVTGAIVDANSATLAALGAPRHALVGRPLSMFLAGTEQAAFHSLRQRVLAHGVREVCSLSFRRRDGSTFVGRVDAVSSYDPVAERHTILCSLLDVSERVGGEERLRATEERYRNLFERSRDAIFVLDARTGQVRDVNPAAAALTGRTREEWLSRSRSDLWPAGSRDENERSFAAHLREPNSGPAELTVVRADGTEAHVEAIVSVIEEDGLPLLVASLRDVTERHRAVAWQNRLEEQLRHSQKMEAIGRLAGAVAHDMNNVLGAVMGLAAVLAGELEPGNRHRDDHERHRADVARILQAAARGRHLTKSLLRFARKGSVAEEAVRLGEIGQGVVDLLARTTDPRVSFGTDLPPELPPVLGDPGQLDQVLMNLCINAVDAMPGGGRLRVSGRVVEVGAWTTDMPPELPPGRYVRIDVADTGVGMSAETMQRVFEPFFTTKPAGRGTGLGLSLVYATVKQHRGAVSIASALGLGTTVSMFLPAMQDASVTAKPVRRIETAPGRRTVLVIDDDATFRLTARRLLERLGLEVLEAEDGPTGLDLWSRQRESIAVVMLDLSMPILTGRQVLQQLRDSGADVPVLICSGAADDTGPLIEVGGVAVLPKPLGVDELSSALEQLLAEPAYR